MQTLTIAHRFRGPLNVGNGGYVCGMLARHIPGAAEVALRAPPPLETELSVVEVGAGRWELRHGTATIAPEFVWSALDCPTGYVCQFDRETRGFNGLPILLGTLSARIDGRPRPGERCVVTSWQTGSEGRRLIAEAALFGEEENLLAVGRAVWVVVDRQVQLGKT